jgi:hypothetical protein
MPQRYILLAKAPQIAREMRSRATAENAVDRLKLLRVVPSPNTTDQDRIGIELFFFDLVGRSDCGIDHCWFFDSRRL